MSPARIVSAVLLILLAVLSVYQLWFGLLFVFGLTVGGLYEFLGMMRKTGVPVYPKTGIAMGAAITLITFFDQNHSAGDWNFYFILFGIFLTFVRQFFRQDNEKAVIGMATTLFGVLYIGWLLSFLIKIRFSAGGFDGAKLLGFIILVVKSGDIGALLVGSRIGRHPLFPSVSPHKTVEGLMGSVLFSIAAALAAQGLLPAYFHVNFWHAIGLGAAFSILGQFGDMTESLIKRDCGIKDSSKLLPGLGGVMDVIDSLLFCAPVFYFYIVMMHRSL